MVSIRGRGAFNRHLLLEISVLAPPSFFYHLEIEREDFQKVSHLNACSSQPKRVACDAGTPRLIRQVNDRTIVQAIPVQCKGPWFPNHLRGHVARSRVPSTTRLPA
ncbi:MAG: hypothetical protein ACTSU9_07015 [Promethearchaeota archaeon]